MNYPGKVKTKVWLLILAVFLLGGVAGGSVDRLLLLRGRSDDSSSHPRERGRGGRQALEKMKTDLNLTDEQTASIRAIFDESRKDFSPRKLDECPGFKEARERTHQRIRNVLTPEQQKRFDEINAQREAERKDREAKEQK